MEEKKYEGKCFCGKIKIEVNGTPSGEGYCHCASCRSWSAGHINAFVLWKEDQVKVLAGQDALGTFHKTESSHRQWCKTCGGHVMTRHPQWKLVDVYAATIPAFPFTPKVHVFYEETVLPIKDGL